MQYYGVVVTCCSKTGREFETTQQEISSFTVAAATYRDFSKHPDCRHIGRFLLKVRLEQPLCHWYVVLDHRSRSLLQGRILGRALDMPRIGLVTFLGIADGQQVIREDAPCFGMIGHQLDCLPERRDRPITTAGVGARQAALEVRRSPLWLLLNQLIQHIQRSVRIACTTMRGRENQFGRRMRGYSVEDFPGLLGRKCRISFEQSCCVLNGDFQRAGRFGC